LSLSKIILVDLRSKVFSSSTLRQQETLSGCLS